jgi:hypothetical protein
MSDYVIHPLTTRGPGTTVTAGGGEPLRCCLRDATAGEELLLFNHEPPLPGADSPYREKGAVFTHLKSCDVGPLTSYPSDWVGRRQVLRAYDARGWIHESTHVHDGSDPDAAIASVLAHQDVVEVHSRNVAYGCYMFRITRA